MDSRLSMEQAHSRSKPSVSSMSFWIVMMSSLGILPCSLK